VNNHLRRLTTLFLSLAILHTTAAESDSPTLNEILQKHLEAMGGLNNWNRVESIRLKGTIEREEQTVDIVIIKKRPDQIRATVTIPFPNDPDNQLQVIRAHDGKTAWTATRLAGAPDMVKEELDASAAAELLADAGVMPRLIKLWRGGADLQLLGNNTVNGENAFIVHAVTDNGQSYKFYISSEHFRTVRFENPTQHSYTDLHSYKSYSSVWIPTRSEVYATQTGTSVMDIHSVEIGVGIYEEYFASQESH